MTRRRDLMCEDIFGCAHEPEIAVSDDATGEIVGWRCRCGREVPLVQESTIDGFSDPTKVCKK